jgi:transposase
MAPEFVAPYRLSGKQGKNESADAAAICEAVQRPSMRFVPVKSTEQQGQLMMHRARQVFASTTRPSVEWQSVGCSALRPRRCVLGS